jgi:hypothetical protein
MLHKLFHFGFTGSHQREPLAGVQPAALWRWPIPPAGFCVPVEIRPDIGAARLPHALQTNRS